MILLEAMQNAMAFFWWLATPLQWIVKAKVIPENVPSYLNLDPKAPVLYVLAKRSFSDLLVLYWHCKKNNLPLPTAKVAHLNNNGAAAYLYLSKLGLLQPIKSSNEPPTPLQKLCEQSARDKSLKIQLVPVSIIWGRSPGTSEKSLFKLLFPDDEHAGVLQKIFIVLAQGRDSLVCFGKPIDLREQVDIGDDADQTARKIRRVLRIHFRSQRLTTLGPKQYDRNRVISQLVKSKVIQEAIDAEARKANLSRDKLEEKARYYFREIMASPMHSFTRFFDVLLTFLWKKIYDGIVVRHSEHLRELADKYEIVYVPSHRSHLDYLVLPYQLYYLGLTIPHIAAGINLNFFPIGPILRRGGAFFLRRTFKGNRLYTIAFNEYLKFLLIQGHSIAYFSEGGRSRTGRLLAPKTGMLSMIIQNFLREPTKPLAFVPIYIGYDYVFEIKSYLKELRGRGKKKESFLQFFQASSILKKKMGRAYVGFGEPVFLIDELESTKENWREVKELDSKPPWLSPFTHKLANEFMVRINRAAVVNGGGLVALSLLSSPQRAMAENELLDYMECLLSILKRSSYCPEATPPSEPVKDLLRACENLQLVKRFEYPGGDVIYLEEIDGVILSYNRNNIMHLFALPSLIASFFQHNDQIEADLLVASCLEIYPFIATEFFLKWTPTTVKEEVHRLMDAFVELKLLHFDSGRKVLVRAGAAQPQFANLRLLGRVTGLVFERYGICAAMLAGNYESRKIARADFEKQSQLLAQRMSILNGISDPEFYDKSLFHNYVDMLCKLGFLHVEDEGMLTIDKRVLDLAEKTVRLISPDVWQSINRTIDLKRKDKYE